MFRTVCALLAVSLGGLSASAADPAFGGDWRALSLAFYVVHPGGPLHLGLAFTLPPGGPPDQGGVRQPPAVFWQAFDAEEHPVARQLERFPSLDEATREVKVIDLPDAPAGIYQVRCATTGPRVRLTTGGAAYGVLACRSRQNLVRDAWLYVPPGATELSFNTYASTVTVQDENGNALGSSKDGKLPVQPGQVLHLAVAYEHEGGGFAVVGVPGILCPDAATARAIRGSVETTPDGQCFAHRFQVRMWEWIRARTATDFAVEPVPLASLADQWLADPRHAGLLGITGPLNFIPRILGEQDLDPASPTYGLGTNTSWLGPAYTIADACNPYHGNPAIRNRILLQEFTRYLKLAENGTFNPNDWDHYAGVDGLGFRQRSVQFGYVAPLLDPPLRQLWTEGAEKVMDCLGLRRVSCENQTSHWLLDNWLISQGSGQSVYADVAREFAAALESPEWNSFLRTGYQQERYGPDATYQGLSAAQQAIYYRYSGDAAVKDGLRRVYDLFNHTIAPEPDGTLRGASSFSHRTSGSWVNKQYNAGVRLMADQLPEAGVWYRNLDPAAERERSLEQIRRDLNVSWDEDWFARNRRWYWDYAYNPWLAYYHTYVFPTGPVLRADWPALSPTPFLANYNNEFVFAKRQGYYAALYIGRTSHEWVRQSIRPIGLPEGWEVQDGAYVPTTATAKKAAWQPTQGLALLWFPGYGNWLLGKNWQVYTIQGTRADLGDQTAWPDYYRHKATVDEPHATIEESTQLFDQPVQVHRQIALAEDGVRVGITLRVEADFAPKALVEQFPLLDKEGLTVRWAVGDEWTETTLAAFPETPVTTARIQFRLPSGQGVDWTFANPVAVSRGLPSRHHQQTICPLVVHWTVPLAAGDSRTLSCRVAPLQ